MRPIDADALKEKLQEQQKYGSTADSRGRAKAIVEVIHAPTIEAEPVKHGTWERIDGKIHGYVCSICEYGICTGKTPYCPQCGARMDGDET